VYLDWAKCAGDWCHFDRIDLAAIHEYGVYIVWKVNGDPLRPSVVVLVGRGTIAARLAFHRLEKEIIQLGGGLRVTWAEVAEPDAGRVAAYLVTALRPLISERLPSSIVPLRTNLPLSA
jgi:hypothetical protein